MVPVSACLGERRIETGKRQNRCGGIRFSLTLYVNNSLSFSLICTSILPRSLFHSYFALSSILLFSLCSYLYIFT